MRKQARAYAFDAFLVAPTADGTDVNTQYSTLLAAIEADGPGTMVHPTLAVTGRLHRCRIYAECRRFALSSVEKLCGSRLGHQSE
jgi:prophage DNA circulation protein